MGQLPYERIDHGNRCKFGDHLRYRVRARDYVEIRCKVCYHVDREAYEVSVLTMRKEAA